MRRLTSEDLDFPVLSFKPGYMQAFATFKSLTRATHAGLREVEGMVLVDSNGKMCPVAKAEMSESIRLRRLLRNMLNLVALSLFTEMMILHV